MLLLSGWSRRCRAKDTCSQVRWEFDIDDLLFIILFSSSVLSVGSAVFDAMFNSTLATEEDEITIPDVEPAAFLALLNPGEATAAVQHIAIITEPKTYPRSTVKNIEQQQAAEYIQGLSERMIKVKCL